MPETSETCEWRWSYCHDIWTTACGEDVDGEIADFPHCACGLPPLEWDGEPSSAELDAYNERGMEGGIRVPQSGDHPRGPFGGKI